jgi:osmotically-inducible protein OsmY
MTKHLALVGVLAAHLAFSQGCAELIVVGSATAAVAAHDRRTVGSFVDDEGIEWKAVAAINADDKLYKEVHINVTSMNGVVLLTGEAPTAEQRDGVLTAVRSVPAVRRIVNEIRITPPTTLGSRSNDAWITGKVKSKLVGTEGLDSTRVKVVTENAIVYLLGLVNKKEGELATEAARQVAGVQRVVKLFEYID